jgi:uncharacterized integral membrane protein
MSDERHDDGIDIGDDDLEAPKFSDPVPSRSEMPPAVNAGTEVGFGLIAFLIVAILLVVFTVQNSEEAVTLRFLAWEGEFPLALIIIGVVAVSVILDEILGLVLRRRRRRRLAEKQELKRLREQNR